MQDDLVRLAKGLGGGRRCRKKMKKKGGEGKYGGAKLTVFAVIYY